MRGVCKQLGFNDRRVTHIEKAFEDAIRDVRFAPNSRHRSSIF